MGMHAADIAIDNDTYLLLTELRAQLVVYKTVQCGLMHEQVLHVIDDSGLHDGNIEQVVVQRKGFCDRVERRKWLGCSHTVANDIFTRLADKVYDTGILPGSVAPSVTIADIVMKLYQVDHEKGRLEKRKAVAACEDEDGADIALALQTIVARHRALINELEAIRSNLMRCIDDAMAHYNTVSI